MEWLITGSILVSFLACMLIFSRIHGSPTVPLHSRQVRRRSFNFNLALAVLFLPVLILHQQVLWLVAWVFAVAVSACYAFKQPNEKQAKANFAADPVHCGRCDYDLTGNVSGVCPECGWVIPTTLPMCENAGWHMWWKQWDISHLDDWRRSLLMTSSWMLVFLGVAVWLAWKGGAGGAAILPLIMASQFAINSIRVVSYGRRARAGATPAGTSRAE